MKEGFEKCPKFKGSGWIRYRVWDTQFILSLLVALKSGVPAEKLNLELMLIKMRCPLCDGDGIHDYIRAVTRADVLKSFTVLKGNMDIYISRCVEKWDPYSRTHRTKTIMIKKMFKTPNKLIEFSQQHYQGIKLNKRILSMSLNEISNLSGKSTDYRISIIKIYKDELTEEKMRNTLLKNGLSEFIPDKIAIPGPYDYPT
jgi:hypothetical protein